MRKSQVLLYVIILMAVVGIFANLLANTWRIEKRSVSLSGQSMRAFYLAQSAVEMGKIMAMYDVGLIVEPNSTGTCTVDSCYPGDLGSGDDREFICNDPDFNTGETNYQYCYRIEIDNPGGTNREVTGISAVFDGGDDPLVDYPIVYKEITVEITGISDPQNVLGSGTFYYNWDGKISGDALAPAAPTADDNLNEVTSVTDDMWQE